MSAFDPKRTFVRMKNSNSLCCNGNNPPAGRMVRFCMFRGAVMKKLATAIATIALIGTPVFAADMAVKSAPVAPAPQVPSWTGLYIGIDAGGAWGHPDQKWSNNFGFDPIDFGHGNQLGAVGGFLAGYNWQFSPAWVFGIEGDFNWASLTTQAQTTNMTSGGVSVICIPGCNLQMSESVDWLTSVRGRIGYVWGQSLWYATGGAAWEGVAYTGSWTNPPAFLNTPNNATKTVSGWVAGAGVEYMATPHVLLRLEYLYYGFDGFSATAPCNPVVPLCTTAVASYSWGNNNVQTVRAALSYKF